ncbi:MAG: hypothetical protein WBM84_15660 [Sedimenticolaceae bacterium]
MMQSQDQSELMFNGEQDAMLHRLANLERSEGAVVSCYLDARAGKPACKEFLNQKAGQIRPTLRGAARLDFENAVSMLHSALDANWIPEARGIAIFARGALSGRHLTILHSATTLGNRFVLYCRPELLPLVSLRQREPSFTLLLVNGDQVQVIESKFGSVFSRSCADEASHAGRAGDTEDREADDATQFAGSSTLQDGAWPIRKALAASTSPLLIAGNVESVQAVAGWLSSSDVERLAGSIPIAVGTETDKAMETVRRRVGAICQAECARLASLLTNEDVITGKALLGYRPTSQALRRREAGTVVIADWDQPGLGLPWVEQIELCNQALREGVRVVLADSVYLRESGGVGCVLREEATYRNRDCGVDFVRVA